MWARLTGAQAARIAALGPANPNRYFVSPVQDKNGVYWLPAGVISEPMFSHYNEVLSALTPEATAPEWPASDV